MPKIFQGSRMSKEFTYLVNSSTQNIEENMKVGKWVLYKVNALKYQSCFSIFRGSLLVFYTYSKKYWLLGFQGTVLRQC